MLGVGIQAWSSSYWNPALRPVEVHRQVQGQHEGQQRDDQRKHPDIAVAPREQQQQQRARQRDERHQRQNERIPVDRMLIGCPSRPCRRSPPPLPPRPIPHRSASCRTACGARESETSLAPWALLSSVASITSLIDPVPQNQCRAGDQRLHEQSRVEFVHVIFVNHRLIEAAQACAICCGNCGRR